MPQRDASAPDGREASHRALVVYAGGQGGGGAGGGEPDGGDGRRTTEEQEDLLAGPDAQATLRAGVRAVVLFESRLREYCALGLGGAWAPQVAEDHPFLRWNAAEGRLEAAFFS